MSKELDARLAALIERCDETDRLIVDTRRFADLEDENARLRSCLSDDAENARMIMAENEKLRELVRVFYHCTTSGECDECPINGGSTVHLMPDTICGTIHDRMRELGIEVVE